LLAMNSEMTTGLAAVRGRGKAVRQRKRGWHNIFIPGILW